jgi:pimeloyl-ACP methyl ester carboxylesterase
LRPAEALLPDRPILFYDQLGCGRSDTPRRNTDKYYSFDLLANDLDQLLKHVLPEQPFHLYGHSCGGMLAYEYLKKQTLSTAKHHCKGVVLSSTPSDIPLTNSDWENILQGIGREEKLPSFAPKVSFLFQQRHICSTTEMDGARPLPLEQAYANAGKVWCGIDARGVSTYKAAPPSPDGAASISVPTLISRGQHDFVSWENIKNWTASASSSTQPPRDDNIVLSSSSLTSCFDLDSTTYVELAGCSHHGMLERPDMYSSVLEDFLLRND